MLWQLQEAKAKFSEVVKCAQKIGPQEVSVRGTPEVVVISMQDYKKLKNDDISFYEFFHKSPLSEASEEIDKVITNRTTFDRNLEL